jgi:hypothetical protein
MATPTTAIEVEAMMRHFAATREQLLSEIKQAFFMPLLELFKRRLYLQRPHTDDMMQMLDDLGIDPPLFQPISFDGLTFRWRH